MATSTRLKNRIHRIQTEIPLGNLLSSLGYDISPDSDREQQFRCDLHGTKDSKPSARYYPDTNSTYCWACHRSRGPLDYVREKKDLSFSDALRELEKSHNLPEIGWEFPEDPIVEDTKEETPHLDGNLRKLEGFLFELTREKALDMNYLLSCWEVLDSLLALEDSTTAEKKASEAIRKIQDKL